MMSPRSLTCICPSMIFVGRLFPHKISARTIFPLDEICSKYFLFFVLSFKHSLYFYHPLSGGRKISETPHFVVILGLRISTFESEPKRIVDGKYETLKWRTRI